MNPTESDEFNRLSDEEKEEQASEPREAQETGSGFVKDPLLPERLHQALIVNDRDEVFRIEKENSPVQLADALNALRNDDIILFFALCSDDITKLGEIFSYLSVEERIALVDHLPKKEIVLLLGAVHDDDLADFVEDLRKDVRERVMSYLPGKRRKLIAELATYNDDTIGSIMTTEFLSVPTGSPIQAVFDKIKAVGKTLETVRTVFVVDSTNKLLGLKPLEELIFLDPKETIDAVMDKDFAYISPVADKEEAIPICQKYNLAVLPVVSRFGEILGIITFDDVLDVIEEENTEDVLKQAAVTPTSRPYLETRPFRMALSYVIWLIVISLINTFASMVTSSYTPVLERLSALVAFMPALNDTGGNSGDQTTSTITRAMATGEVTTKDFWKVLGKETLAGFLTALLVAAFNFGWVQVEFYSHLVSVDSASAAQMVADFGSLPKAYLIIGLVVSVALVFSITLSKMLGATLPMLAKKIHIDPAVISGPLISCLMDILTLIIYFMVAESIITAFDPTAFQAAFLSPGLGFLRL